MSHNPAIVSYHPASLSSDPTLACCAMSTGGVALLVAATYIPLAPALRRLPRRMTISGDLGVCRFNFVIL